MRKYLGYIIILFVLGMLLNIQSAKAMGFIYSEATYPVTATGVKNVDDVSCLKKGTSSSVNVLWLVEVGDAGINKAAKDGRISQINFIDITEKTVLFFFRKLTTTVYGQ